jgi:hypothetical protein
MSTATSGGRPGVLAPSGHPLGMRGGRRDRPSSLPEEPLTTAHGAPQPLSLTFTGAGAGR